jgi:hypothetical protein
MFISFNGYLVYGSRVYNDIYFLDSPISTEKFINCKCSLISIMVESKVLSERRKHLLELIGAAADEIKQIDELLASLQSSAKRDCFF